MICLLVNLYDVLVVLIERIYSDIVCIEVRVRVRYVRVWKYIPPHDAALDIVLH